MTPVAEQGFRAVLLLLALICFVSFTWAILSLFKRRGPMPLMMQLLSACGLVCTLWQLWVLSKCPLSLYWAAAGAVLYAATLGLFWWAVPYARSAALGLAFTGEKGKRLIAEGPYRWVRHPFYASYMLFWISGAVAARDPLLLTALLVMSFFYVAAIRREEQELLSSDEVPGYASYRARTGCLLPRWKS